MIKCLSVFSNVHKKEKSFSYLKRGLKEYPTMLSEKICLFKLAVSLMTSGLGLKVGTRQCRIFKQGPLFSGSDV